MPDDEMEMAVDFGQPGFGEDIDIDLDFPAGEPDDDMDLGDFDAIHDIQNFNTDPPLVPDFNSGSHLVQNFNSDTRDELMAEGDDASYGMVDAIDIDPNASTALVTDVDIELEQTVESIWQQDPQQAAHFQPDTGVSYLNETVVENMDAEKNDVEASEWLPAATTSQDTDIMDHANSVSVEKLTAIQETYDESHEENPTSSLENVSPPIQTSHINAEASQSPSALDSKGIEEPSEANDVHEDGVEPDMSHQLLTVDHDEESAGHTNADDSGKPHSPVTEVQELQERPENDFPDEESQSEPDHAEEHLVSHGLGQLGHSEANRPDDVKEDHADPSQPEEAYESADDASQFHEDTTNNQTVADDNAPQADSSALNSFDPEYVEADIVRKVESDQKQESTGGVGDRDDPVEITNRYGVYISYGETDYRLFASSDDDDPNQYFLTDKAALDVSLSQFLTNLREVISEEISPLDDLVLEIDGLGLEFSESTTPDFLSKFTFGDLVILYDKLVKNEQAESYPPIYTFLSVKPNCSRRMMALGESANAGRGLSEVGLYRDSSPLQEEQVDDVGSPDTNFSTGDYDDGDTGSILEQENFIETGGSDTGELENSPPLDTEAQLEHASVHDEGFDEVPEGYDNENEDNSVDDSANAVDDEYQTSISKQGICPLHLPYASPCTADSTCLCDNCYEVELNYLVTSPPAEFWSAPNTIMRSYNNNPKLLTLMANHPMPEDDATSESLAFQSQELNDHNQQPNVEPSETDQPKPLASGLTPVNTIAAAPNSEHTSVTATLDGEDYNEEHDEIDYNSDEDEVEEIIHVGTDGVDVQKQSLSQKSQEPVDDEITWESDDEEEEDKNETQGDSPKDTVQVSSLSRKRSQADSDGLDDAGEKTGMDPSHLISNQPTDLEQNTSVFGLDTLQPYRDSRISDFLLLQTSLSTASSPRNWILLILHFQHRRGIPDPTLPFRRLLRITNKISIFARPFRAWA
ncbi:hypothetical protein F5B22DRAFT_640801 [Xylaria bambusicola]|uniref:uncharacterized protein n=1 Tax=Xylaria bambusicola TaxID=326684 RepID=UPI002008D008|nr:uncharacterized protein F5B22DRAFT_640801 [Xylaria bambusicola]KAI0527823.1 hypothetical protein F5B22DRAFT_640801 [Xylaria bambusicola]